MSPVSISPTSSGLLVVQGSTPDLGQALIASSNPVGILTWTAPNDGQLHTCLCSALVVCSSTETGGQIKLIWHSGGAGGGFLNSTVQAGGLTTGNSGVFTGSVLCDPGQTVFLQQQTSLVSGAAVCYASLVGA